ncbi:MAG: nickel pincer cofactor biosynthesis protein LarB [Candidatus Omnitrophica bacterium]|nr:nickel pincer cofactor biosynthesis protein LarB [Candidatus Omnitrophota bacterium]
MAPNKGYCDLGFAKVDLHRQARRGFAEVIYCPGKTKDYLKKIIKVLGTHKQPLLLTRLEKNTYTYLKKSLPGLTYNPIARAGYTRSSRKNLRGHVTVVSAGTADIPVAEEAVVTLQVMGNRVEKLYDVGVAGVHRLFSNIDSLKRATVIVVVAGMEGALASLVSGLTSCPIIAVPTSCGYGANFAGLSALLTMLNSCSPGIAVVNIDNGFGAGYMASLINRER